MSTLRTRLDRAEEAASPAPVVAPTFVIQREGDDGPTPSDVEVADRIAAAEAAGSAITLIRVRRVNHSPDSQSGDQWRDG